MKVRYGSSAQRDLFRGAEFYERRQKGLGRYFVDVLCSEIESLVPIAGIHSQELSFYKCHSRTFPYTIYDKLNGEVVEIWRILDARANPARIVRALKRG